MSHKTDLQSNNTDLQNILNAINALPDAGGAELPELTSEGVASDLMSGKELIDQEGNVVTGTFSIDSELNTQDSLITQLSEILDTKAAASGNAFPYNVTVNTSGISNVEPVICYGDDGDSIVIITKANQSVTYTINWSCTNCTLRKQDLDTIMGNYAIFYNFTGDAVISIIWDINNSSSYD